MFRNHFESNVIIVLRSKSSQFLLLGSPVDRRDFAIDEVQVTFEADESSPSINELVIPIAVRDDSIDESDEEVFIAVLGVVNMEGIMITSPVTLCRIADNDGKFSLDITSRVLYGRGSKTLVVSL